MPLLLASLEDILPQGSTCVVFLSILCGCYLLWPRSAGTIRNIAGPPSTSWLLGHMVQLKLAATYGDYEFNWQKVYGAVYKVMGCLGQERLMISDPIALNYILNSPYFGFGPDVQTAIHLLYGEQSTMGVTEQAHKRLRTALNTGFTASAVRKYTPVLQQAAQALAEQLNEPSAQWTNVSPLLSLATLSTMSQVVLGYSTKDLGEEFMSNNFQIMAMASNQSSTQLLGDAIGARLPSWLTRAIIHLPTRTFRAVRTAKYLADRIGTQSVREKRDAASQGLETDADLYGQLLDLHASHEMKAKLTEDELVAQTAILMIAGQDTTANTLSFGLMELARAPDFQDQLRREINSNLQNGVAYDGMPLLNAFIKECLRIYPAEAITDRIALQDMVIPLADSITTATGERLSQIPVRKGQILMLALASNHRLESRWGEDAMDFKPSRWLKGTAYKGEATAGLYANLFSFLGGPRGCLGWRFAVLEMQVFICELVGKFTFTLPEGQSVTTRIANTLLPTMANGQKGAPLCIKRIV
ncbi:cytochrome P450 [Mycena polygramma]|nr:cytochrome P450 [Mycena polygramma]